MKIAVFCAANDHIDPDFFTLTEEFGRWMGEHGHTLVYGGADRGLMRTIGLAVHDSGGQTIGVIPRILSNRRIPDYLDVDIPCDNLSDRKDIMLAQSDVCVALPGGIGTLDEIFTVAGSHTIGYHDKRVVLYDMKGFWQPLIHALDDLEAKGFVRGHWTDFIQVASNLDEVKALL